jgi:hypothetical protein
MKRKAPYAPDDGMAAAQKKFKSLAVNASEGTKS